MRSTPPGSPPASGDLTARARIRDAAVDLIGREGTHRTSIRRVAEAAGVSPGLVQHHFGSKAGLCEACDAYVIETMIAQARANAAGRVADADVLSALYDVTQPVLRYLARTLIEGSPAMVGMLDRMVALTEEWFSERWPERYPPGSERVRHAAALLASMKLGPLVLHAQISRWLGADILARENVHLLGLATLDVFDRMGAYLASEEGQAMQAALDAYRARLGGEDD